MIAPQAFKREIIRPKYRHKTDRAMPPVIAAAPARPVAGGFASAGLLAWIALSKYVDHQAAVSVEDNLLGCSCNGDVKEQV